LFLAQTIKDVIARKIYRFFNPCILESVPKLTCFLYLSYLCNFIIKV